MNDLEKDIGGLILIILTFAAIGFVLYSFILAIPAIVVVGGGLLFYRWRTNSPAALEKRQRELLHQLYVEARRITPETMSDVEFGTACLRPFRNLPDSLVDAVINLSLVLYRAERFADPVEPPPLVCNSLEGARYKDYLSRHTARIAYAQSAEKAVDAIVEALSNLFSQLPSKFGETEAAFEVPLLTFLDDVCQSVEDVILPFYDDDVDGLFVVLRDRLNDNIHEVSGIPRTPANKDHPKLVVPTDYKGENAPYAYLKDTPLLPLFDALVPFSYNENTRFEHTWCLAPPGTGKTQLIQFLVSRDLDKVADDEATIIVIDSQGDLIKNIRWLERFASDGDLADKLIVIEPSLEAPPALNIFDMGGERMNTYSPDDREKFTTIAIGQITYILDALMGGEAGGMTPKQETLFRYIIRLLMEMPEATLGSFRDILEIRKPAELVPYGRYIEKLSQPAQDFFGDQFFDSEFSGTRRQVAWRISKLRENTYFDRMFSHPKSRIDLFTELNSSKVILINTDKERLGEDGTNVFGRFFISALLTASQERASLGYAERMPVYCYIDEAQDYISTDTKIATMLDQCRKMRIALFLAHQRTKQIKNINVLDALVNTSIKFASTGNPTDADLAARAMQTKNQFIINQPEQHFALFVRRETPTAISVRVPFGVMEDMDKMDGEQMVAIRMSMYERYCATAPAPSPEEAGSEEPDSDNDIPPEDDPDNPSTDATA